MDRTTQLTARRTGIVDPVRTATSPPFSGHGEIGPPGWPYTIRSARRGSLHVRAAEVLDGNWTGTSTVPSRGLYPHQWSWDSAFIAIGLRHLSPLRAQTELETLLDAQWGDGRIPHIVFNPSVPLDAYFPSPDFWRSSTAGRAAGAPRTVQTSGIVQPPVHALAAWLVHLADPGSVPGARLPRPDVPAAGRLAPLSAAPPRPGRRAASPRWCTPGSRAWTTAPCWDAPLSRVTPGPGPLLPPRRPRPRRRRGPADGPGLRAVRAAGDGLPGRRVRRRRRGRVRRRGPGLQRAADRLRARAGPDRAGAGRDGHGPARARGAADGGAASTGCGTRRRACSSAATCATDELIPERGVSGLVPLLLPDAAPGHRPPRSCGPLRGPHFGLGGATRLVPSYDLPARPSTRTATGAARPGSTPTGWWSAGCGCTGSTARADELREARCWTRRTPPGSRSTWTRTPARPAGRRLQLDRRAHARPAARRPRQRCTARRTSSATGAQGRGPAMTDRHHLLVHGGTFAAVGDGGDISGVRGGSSPRRAVRARRPAPEPLAADRRRGGARGARRRSRTATRRRCVLVPRGGRQEPPAYTVFREQAVGDGAFVESLRVTSNRPVPTTVRIAVTADADFTDQFELRSDHRTYDEDRRRPLPPSPRRRRGVHATGAGSGGPVRP